MKAGAGDGGGHRAGGGREADAFTYGAAQTAVMCTLTELAELFVKPMLQPDPVPKGSDETTRTVSADKIV
jgi:hypothetical protein